MKKTIYPIITAILMTACANNSQNLVIGDAVYEGVQTLLEVDAPATPNCPPYVVVNNPEVDLSAFPLDKDGYNVLFNGNEKMQGWRGYGKSNIPSRWVVEDGCITGGLGTAVMECVNKNGLQSIVHRVGIPDRFVKQGTVAQLYKQCGMDSESIKELIISLAGDSKK